MLRGSARFIRSPLTRRLHSREGEIGLVTFLLIAIRGARRAGTMAQYALDPSITSPIHGDSLCSARIFEKERWMATDKRISLDKARKMINVDRIVLIGLLSVLIEKDIIGGSDVESIGAHCKAILKTMQRSDEPLLRIHSEEVEAEVNHLLSSFKF